ncbi:MAG TPA: tRNA uridine-5-carboxymethylaminomethyl(34) synthesis enzyme MnmG [Armatimonadetes bacterium]|nr:tRNA uridine-5-carboxymethylaminomethyl(34) synthesis enzyme MnmG [Armatimonadota bacterium]
MEQFAKEYDVIVVGAGHAGVEAGLAAARLGCETLVLTLNLDTIAQMPCNCSIGGPGKGHLVKEIDALGGQMALSIDRTRTHVKMLNTSKGPAVQVLRAQADKKLYSLEMKRVLEAQPGLDLKMALVEGLLVEDDQVAGVFTQSGLVYRGRTVVITTGTFLNGLIHIGEVSFPAGRAGEMPALALSDCLRSLGFTLGRLKTGTVPRLNHRSLDYRRTECIPSDDPTLRFSFREVELDDGPLLPCHKTYTTEETKRLILDNLHRSALYGGRIRGVGPRYCPSIEDKMVRFGDKEQHPVFLEREGWDTYEIYLQGMSNSLPESLQLAIVRSLPGCERAEMMRPGYAIEYDFVPPTQLKPSLETKLIGGLFLAGQINGTSGYEEAAAQGLIAGINAARYVAGQEPIVLRRDQAYIGVLIDDLVTKGVDEPYRILTSRAEYRLLLRANNADLRLVPLGHQIGLVRAGEYERVRQLQKQIDQVLSYLRQTPARGLNSSDRSLAEVLRRPGVKLADVLGNGQPSLPPAVVEEVEYLIKYEGYIRREVAHLKKMAELERLPLPPEFDYASVRGLSRETREKLSRLRPLTLGQARRIPGIRPSDLSLLAVALKRHAGNC